MYGSLETLNLLLDLETVVGSAEATKTKAVTATEKHCLSRTLYLYPSHLLFLNIRRAIKRDRKKHNGCDLGSETGHERSMIFKHSRGHAAIQPLANC